MVSHAAWDMIAALEASDGHRVLMAPPTGDYRARGL